MPHDENGSVALARERFRKLADAAVEHLPAEHINNLAFWAALHLWENKHPEYIRQFKREEEAEKNGTLHAGDSEFLAFMRSIGATERMHTRLRARKAARRAS